jgi:chromosome segregation ATPase
MQEKLFIAEQDSASRALALEVAEKRCFELELICRQLKADNEAIASSLQTCREDSETQIGRLHAEVQSTHKMHRDQLQSVLDRHQREIQQHLTAMETLKKEFQEAEMVLQGDAQRLHQQLVDAHERERLAVEERNRSLSRTKELERALEERLRNHAHVLVNDDSSTAVHEEGETANEAPDPTSATKNLQISQLLDRIEEGENRLRALTRERDAAVHERDDAIGDLKSMQRRIDGKDAVTKRLEQEIRTLRGHLMTIKSDAASKSQHASELRQQLVEISAQSSALSEQLQEECDEHHDLRDKFNIFVQASTLIEAKHLKCFHDSLTMYTGAIYSAYHEAVGHFSRGYQFLLKRCDHIEEQTAKALTEGELRTRQALERLRSSEEENEALLEANHRNDELIKLLRAEADERRIAMETLRKDFHELERCRHDLEFENQRHLQQLHAHAGQHAKTVENLEGELHRAIRAAEENQQRNVELESVNESLVQQLKELSKAKMMELNSYREQSELKLNETYDELVALRQQLAEAQRTLTSQRALLEQQTPRLETLEQDHAQLLSQFEDTKRELAITAKLRQQEKCELLQKIEDLTEANSDRESRLSEFKKQLAQTSTASERTQAELELTSKNLGAITEKMRIAESKCSQLDSCLKRCERDAAIREEEHQREASHSAKALKAYELRLAETTQQLDDALSKLHDVTSRLDQLTTDYNKVTIESKDTIASLKRKLSTAMERNTAMDEQLQDLRAQVDKLRTSLDRTTEHRDHLLQQQETSEQHLRDLNAHNNSLNHELHSTRSALHSEVQSLNNTVKSLQLETANYKRLISSDESRQKEAMEMIAALGKEKAELMAEVNKISQAAVEEQRKHMAEKAEQQESLVVLQRELSKAQAECSAKAQLLEQTSATLHRASQEKAALQKQLEETEARMRSSLSESESTAAKLDTARDEYRKVKASAERRQKELEEQINQLNGELGQLRSRLNTSLTSHRSTEAQLQQEITDLSVAVHKHQTEYAMLESQKVGLKEELEDLKMRFAHVQQELKTSKDIIHSRESELELCKKNLDELRAQTEARELHWKTQVEELQQRIATERKQALLSLEKTLAGDRQALQEVTQGRERALRAADSTAKEKREMEKQLDSARDQLRVLGRELSEKNQQIGLMTQQVEQLARQVGALDVADGALVPSETPHAQASHRSLMELLSTPQIRTSAAVTLDYSVEIHGTSSQRVSPIRRSAEPKHSFGALIDAVVDRFLSIRRMSDMTSIDREQFRSLAMLLEQHELVTNNVTSALQRIQVGVRVFQDRLNASRRSESPSSSVQGERSYASQMPYAAGGHTSLSDSKSLRQGHAMLLQQLVSVERCVRAASMTLDAVHRHTAFIGDCLAGVEAALTAHGAESDQSVLDAAAKQQLILNASMSILSCKIAQQLKLLQNVSENIQRWEDVAEHQGIEAALSLAKPHTSKPSVEALAFPIVHGRDLCPIFAQDERFAQLSFAELLHVNPLAVPGAQTPHEAPPHFSQPPHRAHADPRVWSGQSPSASSRVRDVNPLHYRRADEQPEMAAEERQARDVNSAAIDDDDDDGENRLQLEDAAKKTRAFQKLHKENKRLYNLVRNLTDKLHTASAQAHLRPRPYSTQTPALNLNELPESASAPVASLTSASLLMHDLDLGRSEGSPHNSEDF